MIPAIDENTAASGNSSTQYTASSGANVAAKPVAATPSQLADTGRVTEHINGLFEQLRSNYEQNAAVFRAKTQKALQQLDDMERQLKGLLSQLEEDRDELMDSDVASKGIECSASNNVFDSTPISDE